MDAPRRLSQDSLNHDSPEWREAVEAGVTTVAVCPGSSNVIGGQVCAVKTKPGTVMDKLVAEPVAIKVALGDNPKNYGSRGRAPMTRMGVAHLLRTTFVSAQVPVPPAWHLKALPFGH